MNLFIPVQVPGDKEFYTIQAGIAPDAEFIIHNYEDAISVASYFCHPHFYCFLFNLLLCFSFWFL